MTLQLYLLLNMLCDACTVLWAFPHFCHSYSFVTAADYNNMGKFLNRILGMEVQQQNALFQYFSDTLAAVIQEAKKNGRYDMGILGKLVIILYFLIKQLSQTYVSKTE